MGVSLRRAIVSSLFLAGCLMAGRADAFRLVPIELELEPSGRGATQIFRVENDNREPVAVEVQVMARAMGMEGEDQLTDASDSFVLFPEQLILQPGESQSLRVQWVGDANPARELPFRLIAEQLPIDIGKPPATGAQVRLLVKYVASLYVVPQGAKPNVSVVSVEPVQAAGGEAALLVVLRNDGTARQVLREPTLTLQAGGRSVALKTEALAGLAGENLLAGTTRRFLIAKPADLPAGSLTATIAVP